MNKIRKNAAGFSAVEAVIIILVLVVVGGAGYLVYKNQHKTKATPVASTTATKTITTPAKSTTPTANSTTFKIPELGIQLTNVPTSVADLTYYKYASNSGVDPDNTATTPVNFVAVQFSTQSLTSADSACSAKDGSGIGALARYDGTYVNNEPRDNTAFVKQFNGFYIAYSHPESSCSNSSAPEAIHTSQTATFDTFATNPANLAVIQ